MEMLGEFGEFLLWMAYFQSSVSTDLAIASSNAFTENNVNKRKKGVSTPQSSHISPCCCIRLLQMRSTVMLRERSCHRLADDDALTGTAEELPQTSENSHGCICLCRYVESKSAGRQTVRVERQNKLKLHGYRNKGFWENPPVLNQCNELSKKRRNRKTQLPSHVVLLLNPSNGSSAPLQNSLKSCCISRWHDTVFICTGSAYKSPWLHHCILWLLQQGATLLCLLHQTENNHDGALQLQLPASCNMGRFDLDFKRLHWKTPIKTIIKVLNVGLKKTNYAKSQLKCFHQVFSPRIFERTAHVVIETEFAKKLYFHHSQLFPHDP